MDSAEDRLLEWLARRAGASAAAPELQIGIGDDAAVLALAGRWVATTDAVVEGVDFVRPGASWRDVGYKAMAVNLSDVAAMGCRPRFALDVLALGPGASEEDAREIVLGIEEAAAPFGVVLAGGDISASPGPTMVVVVLLGEDVCGRTLTRSGASSGDEIWATGAFGGSILSRHLRPAPRVDFALALNRRAPVTAAIDVSDGLAKDLSRLAAASRVGARIEEALVPVHPDALALAARTGKTPLEHALGDGEDFELLFVVRPGFEELVVQIGRETSTPVRRIGLATDTAGTGAGLSIVCMDGNVEPLSPAGYSHDWTRSR
ncbi:MAG: thiamine-monophosphate kinase [Planctomycetes bacterium]|nr:thiamine-monophosphate kinase [Planctomycetota bacterium]